MRSNLYKYIEFFISFVLLPVSFTLKIPLWIKMALGLLGFVYVVFVLLKIENNQFKISKNINWKRFWKHTAIRFFLIALSTIVFVWMVDRDNLFQVVTNKPTLWIYIIVIYSVFSVYPQELIFRTFFFQRYKVLFKSESLFVFLNAIIFSLAHLFYGNTLVLLITFFGGLLFSTTFNKTHSTLLVSIEHIIYGSWLFTVGMGDMLGFPN